MLFAGCSVINGLGATETDASASDTEAASATSATRSDSASSSNTDTQSEADKVIDMIDELDLLPSLDEADDDPVLPSEDAPLTVDNTDDKGKEFTITYNDDEETVQIGDIDKDTSGMLTIRLFSDAFSGEITDDPADMFPIIACVVIEGERYDPMPRTGGKGFMDFCFDTKMDPDEILVGLYGAFAATDYTAFVSVNPRTKLPV